MRAAKVATQKIISRESESRLNIRTKLYFFHYFFHYFLNGFIQSLALGPQNHHKVLGVGKASSTCNRETLQKMATPLHIPNLNDCH
jgi:hypothetical protein